jgi:hypothetical protein
MIHLALTKLNHIPAKTASQFCKALFFFVTLTKVKVQLGASERMKLDSGVRRKTKEGTRHARTFRKLDSGVRPAFIGAAKGAIPWTTISTGASNTS